MKHLILCFLGAFLISGTGGAAPPDDVNSLVGFLAAIREGKEALQAANTNLPNNPSAALSSLDKAEERFKDLIGSTSANPDAKLRYRKAKTNIVLARKELEAHKKDSKPDHLTKAGALVNDAIQRLEPKK